MNDSLFELLDLLGPDSVREGFAIAPGIVTNNLDAIAEGRVQVRIPSVPSLEPWARVPAVGGGSGRKPESRCTASPLRQRGPVGTGRRGRSP